MLHYYAFSMVSLVVKNRVSMIAQLPEHSHKSEMADSTLMRAA
jgi:hypothetical protein